MLIAQRKKRPVTWLIALISVAMLITVESSPAQSGRRGSKSVPSAPTATPRPDVPATGTDLKPSLKLHLLIGTEHTKKKLPTESQIYENFLKRLREFGGVSLTEIGALKSSEGGKRAQQEENSFVAVLRFEIEVVQNGRLIVNSQNLEVQCHVFEPRTGKRLVKDITYYQPIGGLGTRTPDNVGTAAVKITTEAAGLSAAEQLHGGLLLALRSRTNVGSTTPSP